MSVMLGDAQHLLQQDHGIVLSHGEISDLIYADDILLVGMDMEVVEKYLACIVTIGLQNGLEMNWQKVELLNIKCSQPLARPDGQVVESKDAFMYLGSKGAADGDVTSELARRLGMAQGNFSRLHQVWCHSGLSTKERCRVYLSCVVSKLLYGLQVLWLNQASRDKLDAFNARCLRKILGIAHSYWSRVSNKEVLQQACAEKLSTILLEHQLGFLGTLARRNDACPVHKFVFGPNLSRAPLQFVRRRGRPNLEWTTEIFKVVDTMFDSGEEFHACISNRHAWRTRVREHCRRHSR